MFRTTGSQFNGDIAGMLFVNHIPSILISVW
jgi:hypothetical protein